MTVVLDASALLAYLRQEPGGEVVGMLWAPRWQLGLSLGDRACLSLRLRLGLRLGLTVLTCDRAWAQLPLDVVIQLLR